MAGFIEEFFYGNIDRQAWGLNLNEKSQKAMQIFAKDESLLSENLTGEDNKHFLEYANAWTEINTLGNFDCFTIGSRLGTAYSYDAFVSADAPFYDYLKER